MTFREQVEPADDQQFNALYAVNNDLPENVWEESFAGIVAQFSAYAFSGSFWYIGDFRVGVVVAAGGNLSESTPYSAKEWLGIHPMEIGKIIHPDDRLKMQSYVVYMANRLAQLNDRQRFGLKPYFIFRMMNASREYTWRIMHYPVLVYQGSAPHYVMCMISDYQHFTKELECSLFIEDKSSGHTTTFYCNDESINLQPVNEPVMFTPRELEVLRLLAIGKISKEIAAELGISKNTVENHKQNMFSKLGAHKLTELIAYAHRKSLLPENR